MKTPLVGRVYQSRDWLDDYHAAPGTFQALTLSRGRRYYAWIESARREETKRRRLNEAIRLLSAGKSVGLNQGTLAAVRLRLGST